MGRKEKAKGVHCSPEKAGKALMENDSLKNKYDDETMPTLVQMFKDGIKRANDYKGLYPDEVFLEEVENYFVYIAEHGIKPSKASLRLWLGCSRTQYYDWETNPKYGFKSNVLAWAHNLMEASYVGRGEKYPTFNTFLLKAGHQYVEASKLDITSNGQTLSSADEVRDLVSQLGLDKK